MNRELKFRAWVGIKMEYDVVVGKFGAFYVNPGAKGNGLDPNDSACLTGLNTILSPETPIMQYVGIKDKNGKEIYEGDIVKADKETWPYFEHKDEENIYLEVLWDASLCKWSPNGPLIDSKIILEVVGNIHENKELLNKRYA